MIKHTRLLKGLGLSCLTLLSACLASGLGSQVEAATPRSSDRHGFPERRIGGGTRSPNNDSARSGFPDKRAGGGTRPVTAACAFSPQELVALIPDNLLGQTASASPQLLFHVPAISRSTAVEFVLRDKSDRQIYATTFSGQGESGMMSLRLPATVQSQLSVDEEYHWYLSVICNQKDRAHDIVVEGLLKRITPNAALAQQLAQATSLEQVKLYQDNQLWHEALTTLVNLQRSQSSEGELLPLWTGLLESAQLVTLIPQAFLSEPLMELELPQSSLALPLFAGTDIPQN